MKEGDKYKSWDATEASPIDNNQFKNFNRNMIVGPLGPLTFPASQPGQIRFAPGEPNQRSNGIVIFNSQSTELYRLNESAVKKILNHTR